MADRVKVLDKVIRDVAAPVLEKEGFRFDGKRTFRKVGASGKTSQIVDFQVGKKFMLGEFAVNLAVYSPDTAIGPNRPDLANANEWDCLPGFRQRLGALIQSRWTTLWTRFLGQSESTWWKQILYGSRDRWWKFSEDEAQTVIAMRSVLTTLQELGLPWLSQADNIEHMRSQYKEISARVGVSNREHR